MTCFLIIPCAFIGLPPSSWSTVRMSWEMAAYEVTNTSPVPIEAEPGERTFAFDVSTLAPLVRRDYDITVKTGLGRMSGDEELEFRREAATEMARRLASLSWEDLRQAVRSAPPPPPQPAPAPPVEDTEDPPAVEPADGPLPLET